MRRLLVGACIMLIAFTVNPIHAQDIDCDKLNFSELTSLLTEAQAKASGGDKAGALALLDQVQEELAQIQAQCKTTSPISDVALTESYAGDTFGFKYPTGFDVTDDKNAMFNAVAGFSYVVLTNDPTVIEAMNGPSQVTPKGQLIAVGVGSAEATVRSVGAFSADADYRHISAIDLLKTTARVANSPNIKFGDVTTLTINDKEAGIAPFAIMDNNGKPAADAYFMFVQLSEDTIVTVVGIAAPGEGEQLEVLLRAVAATVTFKT